MRKIGTDDLFIVSASHCPKSPIQYKYTPHPARDAFLLWKLSIDNNKTKTLPKCLAQSKNLKWKNLIGRGGWD